MSNKNDEYRNPPAPLGYVCRKQPEMLHRKGNIDDDFQNFTDFIIHSGILEVADITIYDCFTVNADSEDEEIIEVPVEPRPKVVEVIDIDSDVVPNSSSTKKKVVEIPVEPCYKVVEDIDIDQDVVPESNEKKDIPVTFKKETDLDKTVSSSETSKNIKKDTNVISSSHKKAVSTSEKVRNYGSKQNSRDKKIHEGTDISDTTRKEINSDKLDDATSKMIYHNLEKSTGTSSGGHKNIVLKEETSNRGEKIKNHAHDREYKKKNREKRISYDDYSDSDSYCKKKYKTKDSCESSRKSHSKSSKRKKTNDYMSDNDSSSSRNSYSNSKHKKEGGSNIYRNSYSCKIKPNRERIALVSNGSDDSDCSSKVTERKHRDVSPCLKEYDSYEYERSVEHIKEEKQFGGLYGEYFCETCKISMNSLATYQSHVTGKKHEKALKAQNVIGIVARTVAQTEQTTKYPKPFPGYYRVKLDCPARIQIFINENLRTPCPGLNNVTEIRGFTETSYYCSLCDSQCSANSIYPHLTGFKHQLNCLKCFRNDLYQKWSYKNKYQIERLVANELKAVEKEQGRGLIKVEKDFSETWETKAEVEMASWEDTKTQSTSLQASGTDLSDTNLSFDIPDPSKSGFYCKVCDSHCNSREMWKNHVVGKRHLKNRKKTPGSAPSKNKYIAAPDEKAILIEKLEGVEEPVVGLNQIREIRKPEINGVTYICFLCSSCVPSVDIINHILSKKHREKYLDSIKHPELETVRNCQMSEAGTNSIIQEICAKVEADKGAGNPEVYYAKSAVCL